MNVAGSRLDDNIVFEGTSHIFKIDLPPERIRELQSEEFDQEYAYDGELGALYHTNYTDFRIWAPTADRVDLILFDGQYSGEGQVIQMEKEERGVFELHLYGDFLFKSYVYRLYFPDYDQPVITVDTYSRATTVNGQRSVVVDLDRAKPINWGGRLPSFTSPSDAIIYELNIRDFTTASNSGVVNNGLFIGLTEEGTKSPAGLSTGLDYLTELGVTHVQFLPIADFETLDERYRSRYQYNWGYDPVNYNVPEGTYSTNSLNPDLRIRELRSMVQSFHDRGIRVIMDVVYNHVYKPAQQSLGKTVPGYYFRYNEDGTLANGSGCGNETASERKMMRKYIVDSVLYWAKEFHMDGFRFDLMGLHDIDTMMEIRKALDEIDPSIIMIGEGWDMGYNLPADKRATQKNANQLPGIGFFNDAIRDSLKGSDFAGMNTHGFVSHKILEEGWLYQNIAGAINFPSNRGTYTSPQQVVQYVEVHDGFTLLDKLQISMIGEPDMNIIKRHRLATTIILLSQGIPFLHSGQEFLRTKYGVENSYASPESINKIDWSRRDRYASYVDYVKGLISLRKNSPALRLQNYEEIQASFRMIRTDFHIIAYSIETEEETLVIAFNGLDHFVDIPVPTGDYLVLVEDGTVKEDGSKLIPETNMVRVDALDSLVVRLRKPVN
ncbi:type I pullulanase [Granulicatella seriolae]|uniref:Type I pullulanase n=1 Tax=Granulicatella seriolae TaxID=2967226 RepID=A0ABT1WQ51_9LACT|nr:type I pullulanase [Granulicatella seriolae]